jgi:hypothetical protein
MTDGAGLNQGPWYLMSFPRHFTALNIFKIKENSVKMQLSVFWDTGSEYNINSTLVSQHVVAL